MSNYDTKTYTEIQEYCRDIKMGFGNRDTQASHMEQMVKLKWDEESDVAQAAGEHAYITKSPDPRNAIIGAKRLLCATRPIISVPRELNNPDAEEMSNKIETASRIILEVSDWVRGTGVIDDMIYSGLIYGEYVLGVESTADLVEHVKDSKGMKKKAEEIASMTPYLLDVYNPRMFYPIWGRFGLTYLYQEVQLKVNEIENRFGSNGKKALEAIYKNRRPFEMVTLKRYWDLDRTQTWIGGEEAGIIIQEENELGIIPFVAELVDGTKIFDKIEDQREPFLYTLYESGTWNRQNLAYTALYTNIAQVGLTPVLKYMEGEVPGSKPEMDIGTGLSYIRVPRGGALESWTDKGIIDPSVAAGLDIAERKGEESTIYRTAMGQNVGAQAAYSTVALLNQAGRLPLRPMQRAGGDGISKALKLCFDWMKQNKKEVKAKYKANEAVIEPAELPENLFIDVELDVALPQDKLQQANIYNILDGKVDPEWLDENILQIGNTEDKQKRIWKYKYANMLVDLQMQQVAQQQQMALQQQQMAMQQQAMQQQQAPMPEEPMPNEPPVMQGGLPQEMAEGGMGGPQSPDNPQFMGGGM